MIKKWIVKTYLRTCGRCFGTGVIELPNGDTKECPICKGKGFI